MYAWRMRDCSISEFTPTSEAFQNRECDVSRFVCENPLVLMRVSEIQNSLTKFTQPFALFLLYFCFCYAFEFGRKYQTNDCLQSMYNKSLFAFELH